jgi:hypothetical protein
VRSPQRASGRREQRTGPGVGEHDRCVDATKISADELGVVGGKEIRVAGELHRMRRLMVLGEGAHEALPAGGALPRAMDQDDVAHANEDRRDRKPSQLCTEPDR